MRKHIDYFYKCYDKQDREGIERTIHERFNEYGYNFDTNKRKVVDYDYLASHTNYNYCKKLMLEKKKD